MVKKLNYKRGIAALAIGILGVSSSLSGYRVLAEGNASKLIVPESNPQIELYYKNKSVLDVGNERIPASVRITSSSNAALKKAVTLPSKYDLRLLDRLTPVKNQGRTGSCWSFAAYSAMESNMLSAALGSYDFSENNLITHHGFDAGPNDGGNIYMSTAYLTRWVGPVLESQDPYPAYPSEPYSIVVRDGLAADKHVQEVIYIPARNGYQDNNDIKSAVMQYGAVDSSMRYDDMCYNYYKYSYYNYVPFNEKDGETYPNHEITIVGWDDNYSASNFSVAPPGNGAFIARNNWGAGYGDKGYFYISYYDTIIGTENAYFRKVESVNNFKNIYQYDDLGMIGHIGYGNPTVWFANVFNYSGMGSKKESVQAFGFYTTKKDTSYELYFQSDFDSQGFNNLKKVGSGVIDMPGYHTVKLDAPQTMLSGKKFAVVVKINAPGESAPIGYEYANQYVGSSKAVSSYNQSFSSNDGLDWYDFKEDLESIGKSNANVCLKAYTDISYDLNNDNKMDILDLAQVSKSYNTIRTSPAFDVYGDINEDGMINLLDLVLLSTKLR